MLIPRTGTRKIPRPRRQIATIWRVGSTRTHARTHYSTYLGLKFTAKANRALFPETKFHIQKFDGLENY